MSKEVAVSDLFAPEPLAPHAPAALRPWKVLLVDDEPDLHAALHLALQNVAVRGRRLQLFDAASGQQARAHLARHPDTALILLDVVMETEHAGLALVNHIRHELGNALVQIILVTGQAGDAPQREVAAEFEINGYRLKSELTADKIFTTVCTALRTHQLMLDLQAQREQFQLQTQTLEAQRMELERYQTHLERLVRERTTELERNSQRLMETQFAMDRVGIAMAWAEVATGRLSYVNDQACLQLGYTRAELLAMTVRDINPEFDGDEVRQIDRELRERGHSTPIETVHQRKDGSVYPAEVTVYVRRSPDQSSLIFFFSDISERKREAVNAKARLVTLTQNNQALEELNAKLRQAHGQLLQSEKMASIGLLAAGVAHEINNPVGYVKSNLNSLVKYVGEFQRVLVAYAGAEALCTGQAAHFADVRQLKEEVDFDYVQDDIRSLLSESVAGLDRVTRIVQNLKDFSRLDCDENWVAEDLHRGIDSTLNVIWNHLKYSCEVKKEYGQLPPVQCLPSQLNQIFLNLLVNAADAIETRGTITIRTGVQGDEVWVEIADTGKGIPPEQVKRIFDPFFTTKPVGKGTGLGLSVSYSIVQKHSGRVEVDSTVGKGSTFRVWLPIRQAVPEAPAVACEAQTGTA
jgi:PAS domain S-box-containing protein